MKLNLYDSNNIYTWNFNHDHLWRLDLPVNRAQLFDVIDADGEPGRVGGSWWIRSFYPRCFECSSPLVTLTKLKLNIWKHCKACNWWWSQQSLSWRLGNVCTLWVPSTFVGRTKVSICWRIFPNSFSRNIVSRVMSMNKIEEVSPSIKQDVTCSKAEQLSE